MGNVEVATVVDLGRAVTSSSFFPGSSPTPQPLTAEYVVEEGEKDDFVPMEQSIHIHLHIFT